MSRYDGDIDMLPPRPRRRETLPARLSSQHTAPLQNVRQPPPPMPSPAALSHSVIDEDDGGQRVHFMREVERVPVRIRERSRSRATVRRSNTDSEDSSSADDDESSSSHSYYNLRSRVARRGSLVIDSNATTYPFTSSIRQHEDETEKPGEEPPPQSGEQRMNTTFVFDSRYSGESRLGDPHTARLLVSSSTSPQQQPLFRWIHLARSMDFDEFSRIATRVPGLFASETKAISDLLALVRRSNVKSVQNAKGEDVQVMEPACLWDILPPDSSPRSQTLVPRTITWICLPYFSLEKYSGLAAAQKPSVFAIQTLLQAQSSRTPEKRDMAQAISHDKAIVPGLCYHIAQLWCLVLDNSLLLTCSRMTQEELCAQSANKSSLITLNRLDDRPKPRLLIRYRGSVLWTIAVEACQTWADFISHFREFWPRSLIFFWHKRRVSREEWPSILHGAGRVHYSTIIDVQVGSQQKSKTRGILTPIEEKSKVGTEAPSPQYPTRTEASGEHPKQPTPDIKPNDAVKGKSQPQATPIFAFLGNPMKPVTDDKFDEPVLGEHLREIEDYILRQTNLTDSIAYSNCPESSRTLVYDLLKKQDSELRTSKNIAVRDQGALEDVVDIFNAAEAIFRFFFEPQSQVATVSKYWGALKLLVEYMQDTPTGSNTTQDRRRKTSRIVDRLNNTRQSLRDTLERISSSINSFNEVLGCSLKSKHSKITVPNELKGGWLHLLMSFVTLPRDDFMGDTLIRDAEVLIGQGMNKIVKSSPMKPLLELSVVLPLEIVSLMSLKLLQDITPGLPPITETYSSYVDSIDTEIGTKRPDRSHDQRIMLVKQEISIIRKTIGAQYRIFAFLDIRTASMNSNTRAPAAPVAQGISTEYDEDTRRSGIMPSVDRIRSRSRSYRSNHERAIARVPDDAGPYEIGGDYSPDFKLASTDAGGFRKLLLGECFRLLDRRRGEFEELGNQASRLEELNRHKLDTTKDRQERAIYAFTIVTIIFLPLSAVASIFGINTNDVRNTDLNQWVYWATAIPVTALVIFLGLLWTGEFRNILDWIFFLGIRSIGYDIIPEEPDELPGPLNHDFSGAERFYDRDRRRYRSPSPPPSPPPGHVFPRRRAMSRTYYDDADY